MAVKKQPAILPVCQKRYSCIADSLQLHFGKVSMPEENMPRYEHCHKCYVVFKDTGSNRLPLNKVVALV